MMLKTNDISGYKNYSNLLFCVLTSNLFSLSIPSRMTYEIGVLKNIDNLRNKYITSSLIYTVSLLPYLIISLGLSLKFLFIAILGVLLNIFFTIKRSYAEGRRDYSKGRIIRLIQSIVIYSVPILIYAPTIFYLGLSFAFLFVLLYLYRPKLSIQFPKKLLIISILMVAIGSLERSVVLRSAFSSEVFFNIDIFSKQNIFLNAGIPLLLTTTVVKRFSILRYVFVVLGYIICGGILLFLIFSPVLTNNFKLELSLFVSSVMIVCSGALHVLFLKNAESWRMYILGLAATLLLTFLLSELVQSEYIVIYRSTIHMFIVILIYYSLRSKNGAKFNTWLNSFVV